MHFTVIDGEKHNYGMAYRKMYYAMLGCLVRTIEHYRILSGKSKRMYFGGNFVSIEDFLPLPGVEVVLAGYRESRGRFIDGKWYHIDGRKVPFINEGERLSMGWKYPTDYHLVKML